MRSVHSLLDEGVTAAVPDGDLLRRYLTGPGESAEHAFAALVDRHGPMVLRVCRGVLRDEDAAQDAFQATFVVLARKAASLRVHETIGPWLHGVAFRTSCCARAASARRRWHERRAAEQMGRETGAVEADDIGPVLHREVDRLPERYRTAVVLCYLEGLTHEQAAERLGCPVGTVRSRLATGRERLRRRLTALGLAPADAAPELAMSSGPSAGLIPAALAEAAVRNASILAATPAAGVVPAAVAALAERSVRAMLSSRLKVASLLLVALGGSTIGIVAVAQQGTDSQPVGRPKGSPAGIAPPGAVAKNLTTTATASRSAGGPARSILSDRIETARAIVEEDLQRLRLLVTEPGGITDLFAQIALWSRRLMEDRLRLATAPDERLDAIREHRTRMIGLEQIAGNYSVAGQARRSDALKAKYHRLEADQLLVEAGGDPEKERPVVQPKPASPGSPPPLPPVPGAPHPR